jgi:gamma-glutamyl:cysteine ligase YbdK (ATP-grasp superfamily)
MLYHQASDAHLQNDLSEEIVRTTIDLEEDVLLAAKEIAKQRGNTLGQVLSDLVRQALTRRASVSKKHGLPLFPVQPNAGIVTPELVNRLRDEEP